MTSEKKPTSLQVVEELAEKWRAEDVMRKENNLGDESHELQKKRARKMVETLERLFK